MDEIFAQVAIAALADAEEPRLTACRCLTRHEPGRHVAPFCKGAGVAGRRDQRRRVDRPNAWNAREPAHPRVGARDLDKLGIEGLDEAFPLVKKVLYEGADPRTESGGVTAEERAHVVLKPAPSWRDNDAALEQQSPQLVDKRGSLADEPFAGAVQGLKVGLCLALYGHKAHGRSHRRLPLRCGHRSCAP